MATTQYQRDIKAINTRIADISKSFGVENTTVQAFESRLLALQKQYGKDNFKINYTKNGTPQISLAKNSKMLTPKQVEKFQSYQTKGQKVKQAKKNFIEKGIKKPTKEQIEEQVKRSDKVHQFIEEHSNDIYKVEALNDAVHRSTKLTDSEVDDLFNMYDESGKLKKEYERNYNPLDD